MTGSRPSPADEVLFVGFHAPEGGAPQSQSQQVAELLSARGVRTATASHAPNPVRRLAEQVSATVAIRHRAGAVVVDTFSGRSFLTAAITVPLARRLGMAVVMALHGGLLGEFADRHPHLVDRTLRQASLVVAPSPFLAEEFARRGHRVTVVPNLVRLAEIPFRDRLSCEPRLLWMRTFEPLYRPDLAVEAVAVLRDRRPDLSPTMTMAGADQGARTPTIDLVERRGLTGHVTVAGYLGWEQKAAALAEHDVYVNTTDADNTPVSMLEAMAAGMPVVSTAVGGLPALLEDGDAGALVPPGDAPALAGAVERLLLDPTEAARLSRNGRLVAERFGEDAVTSSWTTILRRLGVDLEGPSARLDGVVRLRRRDLDAVARIHIDSFPGSALSSLGTAVVSRYYRWQLQGPHPDPVALGWWSNGELRGFLVGGAFRNALSGFLRHDALAIGAAAVRRPGALAGAARSGRAGLGIRSLRFTLGSSRPAPPPSDGAATGRRSFGVLAIAVAEDERGSGAAPALLTTARDLARDHGYDGMHLTVDPANARAVRFYEREGWRRDGEPWSGRMVLDIDAVPAAAVGGPAAAGARPPR